MKKLIFTFYALFLFVATAQTQPLASTGDKVVIVVKKNQTSNLSPKEVMKLKRSQAKIHRMERRAKSDGIVTRREKKEIKSAYKKTRRQFVKDSHDLNGF